MSKKHKNKVELVPWMSARPDNVEKRFIQVGNTLLFNKVAAARFGSPCR